MAVLRLRVMTWILVAGNKSLFLGQFLPGEAAASIQVLPGGLQRAAGGAGGAADHLHPPGDGKRW